MHFDDPSQLPGFHGSHKQEQLRLVVNGPEDPRYFDLRNFPKARPGQSWIAARKEQVAAIAARSAKQRRRARLRETIPYQIKAHGLDAFPVPDAIKGQTNLIERMSDAPGLRQGNERQLIDEFAQFIPHRPYCADVVSDGLQIRKREFALKKRHLQLNGPAALGWMIHDIDRRDAYFAHRDALVAQPTFIAINRDNGHAHAATLLAVPIARHGGARIEPLRYFAAVELGYSRRIGADRHYAGLVVKNPFHQDWRVEWRSSHATTLGELSSWLRSEDMIPEAAHEATTGAGRNVSVFNELRAFGYREVLRLKRDGKGSDHFRARLEEVAFGINGQFPRALAASEVCAIAKSVAKWTWRHFSVEQFGAIQKLRVQKRWAGHVAAERSRPWSGEGISRATWYRRKPKPGDGNQ